MLFGDDALIPVHMKPMDPLKVKHIGTTELTLAAYLIGSILTGHAQAIQPFCGLFMLVAVVLHYEIGDIEGLPMVAGFAATHLGLGLFWKDEEGTKQQ